MTGRCNGSFLWKGLHHLSWQGSANVSRFLLCQLTSVDLLWFLPAKGSKPKQMSAEFPFVNICGAFVLGKALPCQQITLLSANASICFSLADVSRFVLCQHASTCRQIWFLVSIDNTSRASLTPARHECWPLVSAFLHFIHNSARIARSSRRLTRLSQPLPSMLYRYWHGYSHRSYRCLSAEGCQRAPQSA